MIHKKKPILLLSVVGTLGLVVLGLNMSQFLRNQDRYRDIKAPDTLTQEKFEERTNKSVGEGSALIAAMEDALQLDSGPGANAIADVPERPSIILPSMRYYEEKYVDGNTTSAGWYSDNSYQQTEAEMRREAAGQND